MWITKCDCATPPSIHRHSPIPIPTPTHLIAAAIRRERIAAVAAIRRVETLVGSTNGGLEPAVARPGGRVTVVDRSPRGAAGVTKQIDGAVHLL